MALTLTYNQPHFATGMQFEIMGLGIVPNKQSKVLTAADEVEFDEFQERTVVEASVGDTAFVATGTPLT